MKKLGLLVVTLCIIFSSCSNDDESSKQKDEDKLYKMFDELITLSEQYTRPCTNPDEWAYTEITNPCGGQLMIYSKKINTTAFLQKVERYNKLSKAHIKKWKLICFYDVIPGKLKGIECIDEKPKFIFE